jgi:NAD(P)-dependent dehydrogenase (short-subunit alcohol dehydrogenase family)
MTTDLFSLAGRTALITGGSRGIGRMIAAGFIAQGAKVYISARKAPACNQTAEEIGAVALPADVSTLDGMKALAEAYGAHESSLDILVNNAGAAWLAPFDDFPEKGWDKVMDLNVKTPFDRTAALAPMLRASASADRPAKVINIASIDGISVNPQETYPYAASKAGLIHLTRRMAKTLIADNIVVSAIAPGAFAGSDGTRTWPGPPSIWPRAPGTMWWARPSPSTAGSPFADQNRRRAALLRAPTEAAANSPVRQAVARSSASPRAAATPSRVMTVQVQRAFSGRTNRA